MKGKSQQAGSEHHDEHPEPGPLGPLEEPDATTAVSGKESDNALPAASPQTGSANNSAAEQSGQKKNDMADGQGWRGVNAGHAIYRHESSRRRRSGMSRAEKLRRARRMIRYQRIALFGVLGAFVLSVLAALVIRGSAGSRVVSMQNELNQKEIEIVKLRSTVEDQRAKIENLVSGRLPGLTDLKFDRVFEVEHPYVRNITFANVRTDKSNEYEFRIVLENNSSSIAVAPAIDVILLDSLGLEVDRRKLINGSGMNVISIERLLRGDVRSYVGSFPLKDAKPVYFIVR